MDLNEDLSESKRSQLVSTGRRRTTYGYFIPGDSTIIYSSTHLGGEACPPKPKKEDHGGKYIWPVYDSFDIFFQLK